MSTPGPWSGYGYALAPGAWSNGVVALYEYGTDHVYTPVDGDGVHTADTAGQLASFAPEARTGRYALGVQVGPAGATPVAPLAIIATPRLQYSSNGATVPLARPKHDLQHCREAGQALRHLYRGWAFAVHTRGAADGHENPADFATVYSNCMQTLAVPLFTHPDATSLNVLTSIAMVRANAMGQRGVPLGALAAHGVVVRDAFGLDAATDPWHYNPYLHLLNGTLAMVDGLGPRAYAWYSALDVLRQSMVCIREAFDAGFGARVAAGESDGDDSDTDTDADPDPDARADEIAIAAYHAFLDAFDLWEGGSGPEVSPLDLGACCWRYRIDTHDGPWTWRGDPIPMASWLLKTRARLLLTTADPDALPGERALRYYADYCARANHEIELAHAARPGAGAMDAPANADPPAFTAASRRR